jgi:hypothetical protein
MELSLPLFAYGGYRHTIEQQLPQLNDQLKSAPYKLPRRSDRLTQLCLLGLSNTPNCQRVSEHTHLVLASGDANLSSTIINSEQIFASGSIPNPIGFINTVNNSTAYHICVTLGTHGQAISVSRDHCSLEAGFQIASALQHSSASPILLGTVDEIPKDTAQHRRRLNLPHDRPLAEGSFWFQCGHPPQDEQALATIEYCGPITSQEAIAPFFRTRRVTHHLLGDFIQNSSMKDIELPGEPFAIKNFGHYLTQNADYLQTWLERAQPGERLGMVNGTAGSRRLSVTLVVKH